MATTNVCERVTSDSSMPAYLCERDDRNETDHEFDLLRPVDKVAYIMPDQESSENEPLVRLMLRAIRTGKRKRHTEEQQIHPTASNQMSRTL
jgi:hypothetical protein